MAAYAKSIFQGRFDVSFGFVKLLYWDVVLQLIDCFFPELIAFDRTVPRSYGELVQSNPAQWFC